MNPEQDLKDLAFVWRGTVEKVLGETQGRSLFHVKYPDQLRLLSLRTWSLKYKLPLEEILRVLVGYWANRFERKFRKPSKGKKGLGCRIGTICGDVSEEILKTHISKTYPSGENFASWKSSSQSRYTHVHELKLFYNTTLRMFMKRYRKNVERARRENQKRIFSGEFTKRRYPDSPWV